MEWGLQYKIWLIIGFSLYGIILIWATYRFIKEEVKSNDIIFFYVVRIICGLPASLIVGVPLVLLIAPFFIIMGIPYLLIKGIVSLYLKSTSG